MAGATTDRQARIIITSFVPALGVAAFVALGTPAVAASSGAEIKAALVGNTFQGGMGGDKYTSYFGPDGTYKDGTGGGK